MLVYDAVLLREVIIKMRILYIYIFVQATQFCEVHIAPPCMNENIQKYCTSQGFFFIELSNCVNNQPS